VRLKPSWSSRRSCGCVSNPLGWSLPRLALRGSCSSETALSWNFVSGSVSLLSSELLVKVVGASQTLMEFHFEVVGASQTLLEAGARSVGHGV